MKFVLALLMMMSFSLYYLGRIDKGLEHFTDSEGKLTVALEGVEK